MFVPGNQVENLGLKGFYYKICDRNLEMLVLCVNVADLSAKIIRKVLYHKKVLYQLLVI